MGDVIDAIAADTPTYYKVSEAKATADGALRFQIHWYDVNGQSMGMGHEVAQTDTLSVAALGLDDSATVRDVLVAFYLLKVGQFETGTGLIPLPSE